MIVMKPQRAVEIIRQNVKTIIVDNFIGPLDQGNVISGDDNSIDIGQDNNIGITQDLINTEQL